MKTIELNRTFTIMNRNGKNFLHWAFPNGTLVDVPKREETNTTGRFVVVAKDRPWVFGESFERYVKGEGPKPGETDYIPSEMEHLAKQYGAARFDLVSNDARIYQFEFPTNEAARLFVAGPGSRTCYLSVIRNDPFPPADIKLAKEDQSSGFSPKMADFLGI